MIEGPCMCGALDCPSCGPAQGACGYDLEIEKKPTTMFEASDLFNSIPTEDWYELMGMIARVLSDDDEVEAVDIGRKVIDLVEAEKRKFEEDDDD